MKTDPIQGTISEASTGIIFFGTPHKASTNQAWNTILRNIATVISELRRPQTNKLLAEIAQDDEDFRNIIHAFELSLNVSRLSIYSFYETQQMITFPVVAKVGPLLSGKYCTQ